jgi:hypothetical protein
MSSTRETPRDTPTVAPAVETEPVAKMEKAAVKEDGLLIPVRNSLTPPPLPSSLISDTQTANRLLQIPLRNPLPKTRNRPGDPPRLPNSRLHLPLPHPHRRPLPHPRLLHIRPILRPTPRSQAIQILDHPRSQPRLLRPRPRKSLPVNRHRGSRAHPFLGAGYQGVL